MLAFDVPIICNRTEVDIKRFLGFSLALKTIGLPITKSLIFVSSCRVNLGSFGKMQRISPNEEFAVKNLVYSKRSSFPYEDKIQGIEKQLKASFKGELKFMFFPGMYKRN